MLTRKPRLGDYGEHVARLHQQLERQGMEIVAEEKSRQLFGAATREAIQIYQQQQGLRDSGELDETTAAAIGLEPHVITGMVSQRGGLPAPGLVVRVYERQVGEKPLFLEKGVTDSEGRYRIEYIPHSRDLNILTQVHLAEVEDEVTALTSSLSLKAGFEEVIDLEVDVDLPSPSIFERVDHALRTRLQSLPTPETLNADDIKILAQESAIELQEIGTYLKAQVLLKSQEFADIIHQDFDVAYALTYLAGERSVEELVGMYELTSLKAELEQLVEDNVVPISVSDKIGNLVDGLKHKHIEYTLQQTDGLGGILNISNLSETQKTTVVTLQLEYNGWSKEFWEALGQEQSFNAETVGRLEHTLELDRLTNSHLTLVQSLLSQSRFNSTRELAKLTPDEWKAQLRIAGETDEVKIAELTKQLCHRVEAEFPTTAIATGIRLFQDQQREPIRQFLEANEGFDFNHYHTGDFLNRQDTFGVPVDPVQKDELKNGLDQMQRILRVAPKEDCYSVMRVLLDRGYDSAYKIHQIPREDFVKVIAIDLADRDAITAAKLAAEVWERAFERVNLASGMFSYGLDYKLQYGSIRGMTSWAQDLTEIEPSSEDDSDLRSKVTEYRKIFGSVDFCSCEHWESVLGPAAYLVDLLKWIEKPHRNLLTGLVQRDRRPDIQNLSLTKANTETQLPYIDLVNKILEHAVVAASETEASELQPRNTSAHITTEELLACPEHPNEKAYDILRNATNPRAAGLDLWTTQAREFLSQIKVERSNLMAALRHGDRNLEVDLALEILELTPGERDFLNGTSSGTFSWPDHGQFVVRTFLQTTGLNYQQLLDLLYTESANPESSLRIQHRVSQGDAVPSDPCSLDQQELRQANGNTPTVGQYLGLHRFITLWRRVDWTMLELDKAIQALLGNQSLYSDLLLRNLGQLVQLQRLTSLDVLTLLSWWTEIDTRDDRPDAQPRQPSLYARVFLSPVRVQPGQLLPQLPSSESIRNYQAAVATSLQIGVRDINLLEAKTLETDSGSTPSPTLTLENLSKLHREVSLGKALGIPVRDVLIWRTLIPTDPFASPAESLKFIRQVKRYQAMGFSADEVFYLLAHDAESAIRLGRDQKAVATVLWRLRQALRAITPPPTEEQPLIQTAQEFVEDLDLNTSQQSELLAILGGTSTLPEAEQEQHLAAHFHEILVLGEAKEQLIDGGGTLSGQARWEYVDTAVYRYSLTHQRRALRRSLRLALEGSTINRAAHDRILALAAAIPAANEITENTELIETHLKGYLDCQEAKQHLLEPSGLVAEARYEYLQTALDRYLVRRAELETFLAEATKLHSRVIRDFLAWREGSGTTLYSALLSVEFEIALSEPVPALVLGIDADLQPNYWSDAFTALTRLDKLALLYERLGVDVELHTWLVDQAEAWGLLDPLAFPWMPSPNPSDLLAAWERLVNLLKLSKELPGRNPTLADLLKLASKLNMLLQRIPHPTMWGTSNELQDLQQQLEETNAQLVTAMSHRTGWSEADITVALARLADATPTPFRGTTSFSFRDIHFHQVLSIMKVVSRLGISVETALDWSNLSLSASHSHDIRRVVASKFDNRQWLQIATTKQNRLRQQQRDALVTHLLANVQYRFSNEKDLYAYFLIDTEMSPCRQTSRVRQAISSVQLYVQRHLLGLENTGDDEKIVFTEVDKQQWTWRKSYRLWEANRKVFLYPENWILPELRKDKSELFKAFENELQQQDLTSDNAEQTIVNYVRQLGVLSSLEIVGLYIDGEKPENMPNFVGGFWIPRFQTPPILHILARTRTEPRQYYYRTLALDNYDIRHEKWSSWQVVNIPISGEHVIPIVRWGRVFIFWLTFSGLKEEGIYKADEIEGEAKLANIRLNFSTLQGTIWTTPKSSLEVEIQMHNPKWLWLVPTQHYITGEYIAESLYTKGTLCSDEIDLCVVDQYLNIGNPSGAHFKLSGINGSIVGQNIEFNPVSPGEYPHPGWVKSNGPSLPEYGRWLSLMEKVKTKPSLSTYIQAPRPIEGRADKNNSSFWGLFWAKKVFSTDFGLGFGAVGYSPSAYHKLTVPLASWGLKANGCPYGHAFGIWDRCYSFIFTLCSIDFNRNFDLGNASNIDFFTAPYRNNINYKARRLHHPFADLFDQVLQTHGAKRLFAPGWDRNTRAWGQISRQQICQVPSWAGNRSRKYPMDNFVPFYDVIDLHSGRANTLYNWELFFHCPFFIAESLRRAHRFADALTWFHYIYDPTNRDEWNIITGPRDLNNNPVPLERRYWQFRPFLAKPGASIQISMRDVNKLSSEIRAWLNHPFDPHAIAGFRPAVYQKAVVMAYLNNLLDWGDDRFRQHTRESINEATQLYIFAAEVLGDRPTEISSSRERTAYSYAELKADSNGLDDFANVLVPLENLFPSDDLAPSTNNTTLDNPLLSEELALYFCIPPNSNLLKYWDEVESRLFKIRHCLDIEGRERPMPLWDPPIDPALLVQAVAKGVDLDTILSALATPLPHSRFSVIVQRALSVTASVRSLGSALLTALEKRDAEDLALLRSELEQNLLKAILDVRQQQVYEASRAQQAIEASQQVVEERRSHYKQLIEDGLIEEEENQKKFLEDADGKRKISEMMEIMGAAMGAIPNFSAGISFTPSFPPSGITVNAGSSFGGSNFAAIFSALARVFAAEAASHNFEAQIQAIDASYIRREQDWSLQIATAEKELKQLDKQIAAAEVRVKIAEQERDNQQLQINNAQQIHEWMQRKYTNRELYDWMVGQLRTLYYQTYNLAFDLAKRAERCMTYELGLNPAEANFIDYTNWENDRKGLLAGERLQLQLEQLEAAYLDRHRREYELRKHISLSLLDPMALLSFREQGKCFFTLPEVLFDLDLPGHYLRRLKSVSVSIPAVTGPYTTVSATLTLVTSNIRRTLGGDLELEAGTAESIVTSSANHDPGVFQLSHQDPQYLPFEGRGAVSSWKLELTESVPTFDRSTIADVILHLEYTAREGGEPYRSKVTQGIKEKLNTLKHDLGSDGISQLIDIRRLFPAEWQRFTQQPDNVTDASLTRELALNLSIEQVPYMFRGLGIKVKRIGLLLKGNSTAPLQESVSATMGSAQAELYLTSIDGFLGGHLYAEGALTVPNNNMDPPEMEEMPQGIAPLLIAAPAENIDAIKPKDAYLVMFYTIESQG